MFEIDEETVEPLTLLGISKKEAQVLAYLIGTGGATAREIISELSIHQPQLYNILSSLERKGLVFVQPSKPKIYVPTNPSIIMERVEKQLNKKKFAITHLLNNLVLAQNKKRSFVWMTKGIDNFISNSAALIQDAKNELYVESPIHLLSKLVKHIIDACKIGVKVYIISYPSITEDILDRLRSAGVMEIKTHQLGHFYLISSDTRESAFMPRMMSLMNTDDIYGYIFKDQFMTLFFLHYYFEAWRASNTVFRRVLTTLDFPLIFNSHRFATWELLKLKESNIRAKVKVKGKIVKSGQEVEIIGSFIEVHISSEIVNFTIKDENGNIYKVGGDNALVEDVSADIVNIILED